MTAQRRTRTAVQLRPPGLATTRYPLIAGAPFAAGAVQDTLTRPLPPTVTSRAGTAGTGAGTTGNDGAERGPAPAAFDAVTVKRYERPLTRPVTVHRVAPVVAQARPPGLATTR